MIPVKHSFHKNVFAKLGETPQKDWRLALLCFTGGLLSVIAIDAVLFAALLKDQGTETSGSSVITLEKTELVETVKTVRKADSDAGALPASMRRDPGR
jgi:hypothetical protein